MLATDLNARAKARAPNDSAVSGSRAGLDHTNTAAKGAGLSPSARFAVEAVRADFPILATTVRGKPLVYLDSANTSQKPEAVIRAVDDYYRTANANIHRATYLLSERSTELYEGARKKVARFINAPDHRNVVLTTGTTDGINLVAQSYGRQHLQAGDEVLVSWLEHHSNIVPWQIVCEQTGARLRAVPINDAGEVDLTAFGEMLSERTKIVAFSHVSNALGTVNPVREVIARAHTAGAVVLLDGAQAVPHFPVDMQALDCDFYVFSSHKLFGPTGVGILYGRAALLEEMPPYRGGGDMIATVSFEKTTYNQVPYKFEAGTPNVAGVVGLGAAVDYLDALDRDGAQAHEHDLLAYATACVRDIPGTRVIGEAADKAGVLSFVLEHAHPHDVGTILDRDGIAVRTGQHCAQPVMDRFGIGATIRASFAFYNTRADIDALIAGLARVREVFG